MTLIADDQLKVVAAGVVGVAGDEAAAVVNGLLFVVAALCTAQSSMCTIPTQLKHWVYEKTMSITYAETADCKRR